MNTIFKKLDWTDFSFLKEIFSEYNDKEINELDLQNRINYIVNSGIEQLYICIDNNIKKGIVSTRIRENIEENSKFLEVSLIITKKSIKNKKLENK